MQRPVSLHAGSRRKKLPREHSVLVASKGSEYLGEPPEAQQLQRMHIVLRDKAKEGGLARGDDLISLVATNFGEYFAF